MAIIKTGLGVSDIKGSIQGTTFQGSVSGLVVKSKSNKNPSRIAQRLFPNSESPKMPNRMPFLLAPLSQRWNELSEANKQAWDAIRGAWLFTNKFGEQYEGSAYQVFMSYNMRRLKGGFPVVNVPGTPSAGLNLSNPIAVFYEIGFNGIYFSGTVPAGRKGSWVVQQPTKFLSWLFRRRRHALIDESPIDSEYDCDSCYHGPPGAFPFDKPKPGEYAAFTYEDFNPDWPAPAPKLKAWTKVKAGVQPTHIVIPDGTAVNIEGNSTFTAFSDKFPDPNPIAEGSLVVIHNGTLSTKVMKVLNVDTFDIITTVLMEGPVDHMFSGDGVLISQPIVE